MREVQRRGFLKGLGAALGLAVVAPKAVPELLRGLAPAATPLVPPVAAQPVYLARAFIPFSVELLQDLPDFQGDMQRLVTAAYDDEQSALFTGRSSSARRVGRIRDTHGRFMRTPWPEPADDDYYDLS